MPGDLHKVAGPFFYLPDSTDLAAMQTRRSLILDGESRIVPSREWLGVELGGFAQTFARVFEEGRKLAKQRGSAELCWRNY